MRKIFYKGRFFFIPVGIAAFLSLLGLIIMQLWNALIPSIFHLSAITFWQAIGLFILCKLLFGFGKGGRWGGAPWMMRKRMHEHFKNMTPEQKEKFMQKMGERMYEFKSNFGRCGFENEWRNAGRDNKNNLSETPNH